MRQILLQKPEVHHHHQNSHLDINNHMLLKEFLEYSDDIHSFRNDRRYSNSRDSTVLDRDDTRKIRLTLRQINQLRMRAEAHEVEKESEIEFIKQMYGKPPEQPM